MEVLVINSNKATGSGKAGKAMASPVF